VILALARAAVLAISIITATACGGHDGRDVAPRGPSSGHDAWSATFDGSAGFNIWAWPLRHENS
jgi:hypothetical protein